MMLVSRWGRLAVLVATIPVLLVACGDDDAPGEVRTGEPTSTVREATTTTDPMTSTVPTTGEPTSTTGGDAPTTEGDAPTTGGDAPNPSETATTEAKSGTGTGAARAQITDVRLGERAASDRFVVEFAGGDLPDWEVGYEAGPITEAGSGRPVDVDGDAFLVVRMDGASGFDIDAGSPSYDGPERIAGPGPTITEAVLSGDFEAVTSWVLGVNSYELATTERRPFTVTTLGSPSRLVVDVA